MGLPYSRWNVSLINCKEPEVIQNQNIACSGFIKTAAGFFILQAGKIRDVSQ